jgi:hypothetical protein
MVPLVECPSQIELRQLNNDQLAVDRSELLFDHIETCDACASVYGTLKDRPDNFVRKLADVTEQDRASARQAIKRHRLMHHAGLPCENLAECQMPHEQQSVTRIQKPQSEPEHEVPSSQ